MFLHHVLAWFLVRSLPNGRGPFLHYPVYFLHYPVSNHYTAATRLGLFWPPRVWSFPLGVVSCLAAPANDFLRSPVTRSPVVTPSPVSLRK